jgi:hypothetical protein
MPFTLLLLSLVAGPDALSTAPAPPKPVLTCRKSEGETGSHIRTGRTCKSPEEWSVYDARREAKPATLRVTEGQDAGTKAPH